MEITLATWNPGKLEWMTDGLRSAGLSIRTLHEGETTEAIETGATCEENALLKAASVREVMKEGIIAAEDSGLFIEALGGFPGVRTARFAIGGDDERSRLLLERLAGIPTDRRQALALAAAGIRNWLKEQDGLLERGDRSR